jgi:hypothetical protein
LVFTLFVSTRFCAQTDTVRIVRWGPYQNKFNEHGSVKADKTRQKEWIEAVLESRHQTEMMAEEIFPSVSDAKGYEKVNYRVAGPSKIIMGNKDTLFITIHSSHYDPEIGDISLAWCRRGGIYVNFGHICGNLINFMNNNTKLPKSARIFLRDFRSDTDDERWNTLKKAGYQ